MGVDPNEVYLLVVGWEKRITVNDLFDPGGLGIRGKERNRGARRGSKISWLGQLMGL